MIYLDDDFCLEKFNQIPNFLDHLNKTCNFKLYRPVVFFSSGKKPKKKENGLNRTAIWLTSVSEILLAII